MDGHVFGRNLDKKLFSYMHMRYSTLTGENRGRPTVIVMVT